MSFRGALISMTIVHVRCHLLSAPDSIFHPHHATNLPPWTFFKKKKIMLFVVRYKNIENENVRIIIITMRVFVVYSKFLGILLRLIF